MKKVVLLMIVGLTSLICNDVTAQQLGTYSNLEEARKHPLNVKQLNLNNFKGSLPTD